MALRKLVTVLYPGSSRLPQLTGGNSILQSGSESTLLPSPGTASKEGSPGAMGLELLRSSPSFIPGWSLMNGMHAISVLDKERLSIFFFSRRLRDDLKVKDKQNVDLDEELATLRSTLAAKDRALARYKTEAETSKERLTQAEGRPL